MRSPKRTPKPPLHMVSGTGIDPDVCDADDAGRRQRFDDLFASYAEPLLTYFVRRVDDRADAADLLADTFLVTWRRINVVPADAEAKLWLYGVARKTLANQRRRDRRAHILAGRLRNELATHALEVPCLDPGAISMTAALSRLRPSDRDLLILVGWDGLTPAEIASLLGIDAGTARVRIHRARGRLKEALDGGDHTPAGPPPRPRRSRPVANDGTHHTNMTLEGQL